MHDPHGDLIRPNLVKEMRVDGVQGSGTLNSKDISSKVENGSSLEVPQSASAEGEESRKPNIAKRPHTPSKSEVEEHLPLHLEYRSWCPHCVAGKGISDQHRRNLHENGEQLGVTVSLDYCFMTAEEAEEDMRAILVCYDHNTSGLWVLPVSHKGAQEEVVKWVVDKLDESGYSGMDVTLKSDQEPAMISLKQAIAMRRKVKTPLIESPVRESKSNGRIERAIRSWQAQFRTIRHHFEARLGEKVKNDSALADWMIVWVADILAKYRVHENGRTTHELNTQHRTKHKIVGFGEKVHFQFKMPATERDACSNEKSGTGYFVGVVNRNTQYLVSTVEDGIIACSTIRRFPDSEAYDKACLEEVTARYNDYISGGAKTKPTTIRLPAREGQTVQDPNPIPTTYAPRAMKLTAKDFLKHEFTAGCPGCEFLATGLGGRKGHTIECRQRMEMALAEDIDGKKRVQEANERKDQWLAGQIEKDMLEEKEVKPSETQVGTDVAKPEFENPDNADPSVRAAVLGKGNEREELERSTAYGERPKTVVEDVSMNEDLQLEDRTKPTADIRLPTPEKAPAVKRAVVVDDEDMGNTTNKVRRTIEDDVELAENDDDMLSIDKMSEIERKILQSVIFSVDITEVFSPVRVNEFAAKFGLTAGSSFDLTNGWDFSLDDHRTKAWGRIKEEKPYCVIGSPPCKWFSVLMELNLAMNKNNPEWIKKYEEALKEATRHVEFCCVLYRHQLKMGRHFIHEHPWLARSWKLQCVMEMMEDVRVSVAYANMCQFGMTTHIESRDGPRGPVAKPTGFMTSSWAVFNELNKKCQDDHTHVPLMGGRAAACQVYPPALCQAMCRGIAKQKKSELGGVATTGANNRKQLESLMYKVADASGLVGQGRVRVHSRKRPMSRPIGDWSEHWIDNVHEHGGGEDMFGGRIRDGVDVMRKEMNALYERHGMPEAWDDMNNVFLDADKVKAAREVEMSFFKKLGVYRRVPRSRVRELDGKMVSVKWLDTNKGDRATPNYRSRLVAREFNQGKDDTLYASTPPLEALRIIVSHAATVDQDRPRQRRELMVNDVRRAYFYAQQQRNVFIELPDEDEEAADGEVGQLLLCLYGTRDAAREWQRTLSKHLRAIGFVPGKGHPSVFHHAERGICMLVHGDDYFSSGHTEQLDWLEQQLAAQYEIQTQRIGSGVGREPEGKILNRIVRWTKEGYEVEADPRHAELVIQQLNLEGTRSLSSPGVDGADEDGEDDVALVGENATKYRGIAARINYLSFDRPDVQFATKEVCRDMSCPSTGSWRRLEHIGKYLLGRPRLVWRFEMQAWTDHVDIYSDANWAQCRQSRKSTSGGAILVGAHLIKAWSKTQATIAKSSAESELYGIVRATCEGLGFMTLRKDMGEDTRARLHMDATAARGIVDREGVSKIRHLDVNILWLQEQVAREAMPLLKVHGPENSADLMTKHLGFEMIKKHIARMSLVFREGRAVKAVELQAIDNSRKDMLAMRDRYTERQGSDSWLSRGANNRWVRLHGAPRRSLFTPCRVARGPSHPDELKTVRVTEGVDINGLHFKETDDWRAPGRAHLVREQPWTGTTTFTARTAVWADESLGEI